MKLSPVSLFGGATAPAEVNWAYRGKIEENRRGGGGRRTKAVRIESVSVLKDVSLGYQQVERRGRCSSLSNCVDERRGRKE
jgi:hypothetical protein